MDERRRARERGDAARRVIIVNVEPRFGAAVAAFLEDRQWIVERATSPRHVLHDWQARTAHLIFADLDGAEMDGFELLHSLAEMHPPPAVLLRVPRGASPEILEALTQFAEFSVIERPCRLEGVDTALGLLSSTGPSRAEDSEESSVMVGAVVSGSFASA
jgi:DNA-binding response OmpR family regulator